MRRFRFHFREHNNTRAILCVGGSKHVEQGAPSNLWRYTQRAPIGCAPRTVKRQGVGTAFQRRLSCRVLSNEPHSTAAFLGYESCNLKAHDERMGHAAAVERAYVHPRCQATPRAHGIRNEY